MWRYLLVLLVCCAACEKPTTKPTETSEAQPYVDRKNEELKDLKVGLEATTADRADGIEKSVESSQE